MNVGSAGRAPSWCVSVVALTLACLPGSFTHLSLDRAPRARVGAVRAAACGTQRSEIGGSDVARVLPLADLGLSFPCAASAAHAAPYDGGHAAVVSVTRSVPPLGLASRVDIAASTSIFERPLVSHAGRAPPCT